mgnify:CR=1 FL=1
MLAIRDLDLFANGEEYIRNSNFEFNAGTYYGIYGGPGAGKSLLFSSMVGLKIPENGDVVVDQMSLYYSDFIELSLSRKKMGVVFQIPGIISNLDVYNNVRLAVETHHGKKEDLEKISIIENELENFDLLKLKKHRPIALSIGQLYLLAVARAFACAPKFFIWDECFNNIPKKYRKIIIERLNTFQKEGSGVILFSNEYEKLKMVGENILTIKDGDIMPYGL